MTDTMRPSSIASHTSSAPIVRSTHPESPSKPRFWRDPFVSDMQAFKGRSWSKKSSPEQNNYYDSRQDAFAALRRDGATLEEIAQVYGVTGERVRQVLEAAGKNESHVAAIDPIRTVNVCRKANSLSYASGQLGKQPEAIRKVLKMTGYLPAMERLWAWRRAKNYQKISDGEKIEALQRLAAKIGRTPGMNEASADPDTPTHMTYVRTWGSWRAACEAAGLRPNERGGAGHVIPPRERFARRTA